MGGHPLGELLRAAADGKPPPPDGRVRVVPPLGGPVHAVVGFPSHHVVAAPVSVGEVDQVLAAAGEEEGAALHPSFLIWLGQRLGSAPGSVDVVLVAPTRPATPPLALTERSDLATHPRVRRARRYRSDVEVFTDTDARGLMALGRGVAGRLEVVIEVDDAHRGGGVARGLASAAAARVSGEPLFAQVAVANAAALRAFLAAGYGPVGGECLFAADG